MKNFLLNKFLIIFCLSLGYNTNAQFAEDFETGVPGGQFTSSGTVSWGNCNGSLGGQTCPITGTITASFYGTSYGGSDQGILTTPTLDLSAGNMDLSFSYSNVAWGADLNTLDVELSVDAGGSWSTIATLGAFNPASTFTYSLDAVATLTATSQVRFRGSSFYGRSLLLDDVVIEAAPQCTPPTAIGASQITSTTATLSWTAPAGATDYSYEVQPAGVAQGTAGALTAGAAFAGTSISVSGLTQTTGYTIYVNSNCAGIPSLYGSADFSTSCGGSTCDFVFRMSDAASDGWDGSSMSVFQGGVAVATLTGPSGGGPDDQLVSLCDGSPFTLVWDVAGSWTGEKIVEILDPTGTSLYAMTSGSGALAGTTLYTGTSTCPPVCAGIPDLGATVANDEICPSIPFTLSLANPSGDVGLSYQWQESADNITFTNINNALSDTRVVVQTADTYYRCIVNCSFSGLADTSDVKLVEVSTYCPCTPTYSFGVSDGDLISNVEIVGTTLANNTGNSTSGQSYTYYSTQPNHTADLQAGSSYTVSVTVGTFGSQNIAAWIDFNDDAVFDLTERIGVSSANISANGTTTFTISLDCSPPPGMHRLRIRDVYNTSPGNIDPCANYGYGETEDYDVNVLPPNPCPDIAGLAYSNLGWSTVSLNWDTGCIETVWDVEVSTSPTPTSPTYSNVTNNSSFNATGLNASTTYYAHVRADCESSGAVSNGVSSWTTIGPFTTSPTCVLPNSLAIYELTGTTALATWSSDSSTFDVAFGVAPFATPAGPSVGFNDVANDSVSFTGLTAGTAYQYYVRTDCGLTDKSDWAGPFDFRTRPANDNCADAIEVLGGYSISGFSTVGATIESSDPTPNCTFNDLAAVWFKYTPTCNTDIQVNTFGSSYDTNISIWDNCNYISMITCNDDAGGVVQSEVSFTAAASNTYFIRIGGFNSATGDISFALNEVTTCPCTQNVWTGATDSEWSEPTNWTCQVVPANTCLSAPTANDTVIIPAGSTVTPVITGAQGAASLTVSSGSSLIIDGSLEVCGNIAHDGMAFTGNGYLKLVGSSSQELSGSGTFGFVVLDNTSGAQVLQGSSMGVDSALILSNGTFTNGGTFSLNSGSTGTAYLDDFSGAGSYAGDLTVNRYVSSGVGLGQRLFGSAVSGSTVSGLDGTYSAYPNGYVIPLLGCFPNSIDPLSPYSNLFSYDENVPTFCSQAGWFAEDASSLSLTPGEGYSGWMLDGSNITVSGSPNSGPQNSAVLSSTNTNTAAAGWHILSNPYPSPVLTSEVTNGTGLTSVQYYEGSSGAYSGTYQPALVSGSTIPVMQGFTALSTGTGSLALDNPDRVASTNGFFAKSNDWFAYRLDMEISIDGSKDVTYLYYSDNSSSQFDELGDCEKRESDSNKPTLYTRSNTQMMSLNGLHLNDLGSSVPMGLITPIQSMATINFTGMTDFPVNTTIYLEDKVNGVFHNLINGDYTFTSDPSENGTDRFEIHFVLPVSFNLVEPTCANTNGAIIDNTNDGREYNIFNEGLVVGIGVLNGSSNELAAGDYTIEVYDQYGGFQTYDFTVDVITPVTAGIISSASAIESGESIDFEFNGADAYTYEWAVNGQVVAQTEMFSYEFTTPGQYVVEVFAANDICDAIATRIIDVAEKSTGVIEIGNGSLSIYESDGDVVLNFTNINEGKVEASVYNLLGQELASVVLESSGKQIIQNVNWADGYYLVKVQIGQQVVNETILITK